ncbi:hypothetical protein D9613_012311 [Agrocybe pediades]|uniref:non-specific serine/threonine protein kinase n=1 Tax=Agrocybe pediades TaxID=84607 RepID=A0A8H4QES0_9AGAR|nr:hypothetical protein D9613_012311 [Agrocybe pediades]
MSLSWHQRKARLAALLKSQGDEDAEGLALDRLMHGQSVIGKTSKTTEIESLRFKDRDLDVVGTLGYGQFGVIDVVTCRLDNRVYVRKSIDKAFALRTRDQCFPQFERDILLQARKTDSAWAPHLLCAFHTDAKLSLVMDYAEGGNLWDVLESSPYDGRVPEADLRWWVPQIVSAIHWCHSQGFAHRDIKPHNFVLTPDAHVLLIDFGSAAPLLPPNPDGSQLIAKKYCLVLCGTCDYISPEILSAHEEALVAMEMEDEGDMVTFGKEQTEGYGVETDWWSLGAMLYELAYGVAPFFAEDIRHTYSRIMNHEKSLRFDQKVNVSHEYQHFCRRLLTNAKQRLGRRNVMEITDHPLFDGIDWTTLSTQTAPTNLHLPQFTYSEPKPVTDTTALIPEGHEDDSDSYSQGFAFSAFFQPSSTVSPGLSILRPSPSARSKSILVPSSTSFSRNSSIAATSFIGFSWGPLSDAFPANVKQTTSLMAGQHASDPLIQSTPLPPSRTPARGQFLQTPATSNHTYRGPSGFNTWGPGNPGPFFTPKPLQSYTTPMKAYSMSPYATLPRTGTVRRTAPRRSVSDREAMRQLVDCIGMSARKKVLESGRKPKSIGIVDSRGGSANTRRTGSAPTTNNTKGTTGTVRKELRFDRFTTPIPQPDYSAATSSKHSGRSLILPFNPHGNTEDSEFLASQDAQDPTSDPYAASDEDTDDSEEGIGGPPSPSPSPRPGSAMSMMSMSRRSATPTTSGRFGIPGRLRSGSGSLLIPAGDRSVTATTTTNSGLLSIPSAGPAKLEFKMEQPPRPPPARTMGQRRVVSDTIASSSRQAYGSTREVANDMETTSSLQRRKSVDSQRDKPRTGKSAEQDNSKKSWLDELETRHAALMQEIGDLEERFDAVAKLL